MKPGHIRPLYLEPRLHSHKQSVKQKINNHGACLAVITYKTTKNVWQTIGPPSMRLLSDLPKICTLRSDEFQKLWCTPAIKISKQTSFHIHYKWMYANWHNFACKYHNLYIKTPHQTWGCDGRDRMDRTTTYAISAYHH
jgi:hypothetical protein